MLYGLDWFRGQKSKNSPVQVGFRLVLILLNMRPCKSPGNLISKRNGEQDKWNTAASLRRQSRESQSSDDDLRDSIEIPSFPQGVQALFIDSLRPNYGSQALEPVI